MLRCLFAGAIAIIAQVASAHAQERWITLGSGELGPGLPKLSVDASTTKGGFEAIRLTIDSAAVVSVEIALSECRFEYRSLKAGERLSLPRVPDFIDRISLDLRDFSAPKSHVTVEGLQSASAAVAMRESFSAVPSGPTLWGSFELDPTTDRRSLSFCDARKVFDEIELQALDNDVFIRGMTITYHPITGLSLPYQFERAQTELVPINTEIKRNSRTKRLRLNGTFPIAKINLAYEPSFKGGARVEVHQYQSNDLVQSGPGTCPLGLEWSSVQRACAYISVPLAMPKEGVPTWTGPPLADCVSSNMCTPVAIFFGTNRDRADKDGRVGFGQERAQVMSLGQAIITVPKPHGIGKIERPSYFSVRDWFGRMAEDPTRHFTIPKEGIRVFTTPEQFIAAVLAASKELPAFKDHAFVYVHGFLVQFDDALYRLAQLTYDLGVDKDGKRIPFGLPFLFSWPTVGGLLDYDTDTESARASEAQLRAFLELVVTKSQAKNVHLIAHSMGNQPLLEVMKEIASAAHPAIKFNQVILAAPDVDRRRFAELAALVTPIARNITLYASSRDEAMILSRKVHSDRPRAGDVPADGPVVVKGVYTIDASELSTEVFWTPSHSKYAEDTLLLQDLGKIVRVGTTPPHDRTLDLGRRPVGDYWYWFFPRPRSLFGWR